MNFFDPTIHPMVNVLQRIELTLLGVSIILRFINDNDIGANTNNLYFTIFCGLVILLSIKIPLSEPIWYRQIYAFANMILIVLANVTGNGSELLLYWTIIKISFFLDIRIVILNVLMSGIAHVMGILLNYTSMVEASARSGVFLPSSPRLLIIGQISYYIGASILCILLSNLVLAEHRSRTQAIILTEEVKKLAADLERQRIAREIHDSLGHTLTALDIQLELAQKLQRLDHIQTSQAIGQAKNLTTQCLQDVRLAVQNIRDEPFHLKRSIQVLVDRFRPAFNIHVQIDLPTLPLQPSHQIYCILQEGFTNIQKHAFSTEIYLRGGYDDQNLWLQLQDNGYGFEPQNVQSGFGLRNMTERVQLLGGQLHIESIPQQGTTISLSIPLVAK